MKNRERGKVIGLLSVVSVTLVLATLVACGATEPTPTPVPPAQPAAPAAPKAAPQPTATLIPGAPTPLPAKPTPTRVLPTATPAVVDKPVYGGTLRTVGSTGADTFDPAYNTQPGALVALYNLYEGLFDSDPQGNVVPGLAESWEFSADGKKITLHLRDGVKFHDGTAFTAQAVKWNLDRIMDPEQLSVRRSEIAPHLAGVQALDNQTLELQLNQPFRPLLPTMGSDRLGFLVSPAGVEKYEGGREGDFGKNPVGTGPFKFVEWVVGQRQVLERNDDYWRTGKPYMDRIVISELVPGDVQKAMIRTGETDIIDYFLVSGTDIPILERNPQIRILPQEGGGTFFFKFNTAIPPYDNKPLRQAFSYALDRAALITSVWGGVGQPAYTLISGGWAHNPEIKPIVFDLTKAKQKLAEAGYPDGVTFSIGCSSTNSILMTMCEVAQASVKEAGINLEIQRLLPAGYYNPTIGFLARPGFGPTTWAIRVDPHTLTQLLLHSEGFSNQGAYRNDEVNRLIGEAASIYDVAKAKAVYDKIQATVAEDAYLVFVNWRVNFFIARSRVQNFQGYIPPVKRYYGNVWLER